MLSARKINHKITLSYIIAVAILVLLSSSVFLSFSYVLKQNEASAALVNISGQQRMLSQRTALFSTQLVTETSPSKRLHIRKELNQTVKKMLHNHALLTRGSIQSKIPLEKSETIHEMYYSSINVHQQVTHYIQSVTQLLKANEANLTPNNANYLYIQRQFTPLLKDLNTVVSQYQKEGEQQVSSTKQMGLWLWLAIILALILQIQLIFRPMSREVSGAMQEREKYEEKLEYEVKQQTEKLVQANIKLNKLSNTDPLTGLRNRRSLEQKLQQTHKKFTEKEIPYAIAVIDIDYFKILNDSYGHDCGDKVLQKFAENLMYFLDDQTTIARYGGEEFVILLPNCDTHSAAETINKLLDQISKMPTRCENNQISISFSAGIIGTDDFNKVEVQELLRLADIALYEAKDNGRKQVVVYQTH